MRSQYKQMQMRLESVQGVQTEMEDNARYFQPFVIHRITKSSFQCIPSTNPRARSSAESNETSGKPAYTFRARDCYILQ